uniref:Uncharacterized protein n=1 Tax=Lactuca sativa TaxID=4236 RepID=A0A9R1W8R4_LACSA|nr:hypothetical protein LSAT_V11C300141730 [Lactuca sativa]
MLEGDSKHHKSKPEPVPVYAAITVTPTLAKSYTGTLSHCTECNFHHIKNYKELICNKCNMRSRISMYCRKTPTITTGRSRNCFEGNQPGLFRKDYPKLKNQGTYDHCWRCSPRTACSYWYISYQQCLDFTLLTTGFETRQKHKFHKLNETYIVDMAINQIESTLEKLTNCSLTLNNHVIHIETKDPCW